jgi:chromosome segregation ATPase
MTLTDAQRAVLTDDELAFGERIAEQDLFYGTDTKIVSGLLAALADERIARAKLLAALADSGRARDAAVQRVAALEDERGRLSAANRRLDREYSDAVMARQQAEQRVAALEVELDAAHTATGKAGVDTPLSLIDAITSLRQERDDAEQRATAAEDGRRDDAEAAQEYASEMVRVVWAARGGDDEPE